MRWRSWPPATRGEDRHVRLVQEVLRRGGLTSAVLQNQVHAPYDTETAQRLLRDGEKPTVLRGNCSGKHAGMVLFAKASGWPIDTLLAARVIPSSASRSRRSRR